MSTTYFQCYFYHIVSQVLSMYIYLWCRHLDKVRVTRFPRMLQQNSFYYLYAQVNVTPLGGMGKSGDSHKRHFYTLRILTLSYWVIMTLGNPNIEFHGKSRHRLWGMWRILWSNLGLGYGFWYNFCLCQNRKCLQSCPWCDTLIGVSSITKHTLVKRMHLQYDPTSTRLQLFIMKDIPIVVPFIIWA